jgi:hypothetical protein
MGKSQLERAALSMLKGVILELSSNYVKKIDEEVGI